MSWIGKSVVGLAECQPRPTLSQEVASLLQRLQTSVENDRRDKSRTAIPQLFNLAPVPGNVPEELAQEMVVIGKDISDRGIGFYHEKPIPYRRGLLSLDLPGAGPVRLEVDLLWCRFTSQGWYESGGRLLRVVSGDFPVSCAG